VVQFIQREMRTRACGSNKRIAPRDPAHVDAKEPYVIGSIVTYTETRAAVHSDGKDRGGY